MSIEIDFSATPFLDTSETGAVAHRLNARCDMLLTRHREALQGKRVLDLASHDGRFTYGALTLGATHVTAVEGRSKLVDHARRNLDRCGFGEDRVRWVCSDIYDFLAQAKNGSVDVVICFGFFYHTVRHVELLRELRRLGPELLILDTTVYREHGLVRLSRISERIYHGLMRRLRRIPPMTLRRLTREYLVFWHEDHRHESATIDPFDVAAVPTRELVELLLKISGFGFRAIDWRNDGPGDWSYLDDYQAGRRVSYLATPEPR